MGSAAGAGVGAGGFGRPRTDDIFVTLDVSLEELFSGAAKQVSVPRLRTCKMCEGSGGATADSVRPCTVCQVCCHLCFLVVLNSSRHRTLFVLNRGRACEQDNGLYRSVLFSKSLQHAMYVLMC